MPFGFYYNAPMHAPPATLRARAHDAEFARLMRRAQHLPPPGSRPLTVAARVAGWITAKATRALHGLPGVHIEPEAVHLTSAPRQRMRIDDVLMACAQALQAAGCLKAWRGELIDVLAEGRHVGRIERAAMRPLGMLTQAVHLNAWSPDACLWIARRSEQKTTDPGLWDTLSGGLVAAGEDPDGALLRETLEEAGLAGAQLSAREPLRLVLRMHRRIPEGYQVENLLSCDCVLPATAAPVNLDGEVSEIRCVTQDELRSMLARGCFTLEAAIAIHDSLRRREAGADGASFLQ